MRYSVWTRREGSGWSLFTSADSKSAALDGYTEAVSDPDTHPEHHESAGNRPWQVRLVDKRGTAITHHYSSDGHHENALH